MVSQTLALVLASAVLTCPDRAPGFRAGGPNAGISARVAVGPATAYPEPHYVPPPAP
jgi:hypothetical protein